MNNYSNPVTVTGNPASFEASGNGKLLSLSVPFSPIQDLHGYANPWPGGGGKNLLNPATMAPGYIESSGNVHAQGDVKEYYSTEYYEVGSQTSISVGYNAFASTESKWIAINWYDANKTNLSRANNSASISTFTPASGAVYFRVSMRTYDHGVENCYCALGSDTTFAPYSNICPISGRTGLSVYVSPTTAQADATTYAVDWTTPAGTVYGGTLDVVTGVLTVDRAMVTLNGSEAWVAAGNQGLYTELDSLKKANDYSSVVCDKLQTYTSANNSEYRNSDYGITGYRDSGDSYPNQNWIYAKAAGITTAADFKTWLSSNPLTVVYELATPITYQLTPTQVELLIGQNNVWSDSNEAVTLTYVIELFTRYTFIVNGNDYTGLVERDSYRTAVTPVYGETIQTLDGVGHTALLRVKGSLTVKLNPQTAAQTAAICADLLNAPCEVQYKCLQRNVNVTALMVLDVVSAMFLSRCLYLGQKWNDVDEIVLKEL